MIGQSGLSDAQKKEWLERMKQEEGFRDALILETYITMKNLAAMAETVAAQFSGGAAAKVMAMMGMGGNGGKEG